MNKEQFPDNNPLENKEQEPRLPVFIVYRDNSTYQELIPMLVQKMEQAGRKVEIKSFPAGTPEEEMKSYLEQDEVKAKLAESELLMDYTAQRQIAKEEKIMAPLSLDQLSSNIFNNAFFGQGYLEKAKTMMSTPERFAYQMEPLQKAVELFIEKHPETENVYVCKTCSSDHVFSFSLGRGGMNPELAGMDDVAVAKELLDPNSKYYSQALARYVNELGMDPSDTAEAERGRGNQEVTRKIGDKIASQYIKKNLEETISDKNIEIVDDITTIPLKEEDLVLFDDHYRHKIPGYFAEQGKDVQTTTFKELHKNTLPIALTSLSSIEGLVDTSDLDKDSIVEGQVKEYFEKK